MKPSPPPDIIENLNMVTPTEPWKWIVGISIVLLLAGAGALLYFNLKKKGMLPFQPKPIPPDVTALERLASIRHLIDEGKTREFVREASGLLRSYIESRFNLSAPRLSTEEFLYEAEQDERLEVGYRERLSEFLFGCDKVKFALGDLDKPQMESLYQTADKFIRQTGTPAATHAPAPRTAPAPAAKPALALTPAPDPAPEPDPAPAPPAEKS